jgi:hypothetical protein
MTPADLERTEVTAGLGTGRGYSDEMRAVVEQLWRELVPKLPESAGMWCTK